MTLSSGIVSPVGISAETQIVERLQYIEKNEVYMVFPCIEKTAVFVDHLYLHPKPDHE